MDYTQKIEYKIIPASACRIIRNCSGCGRKGAYESTGCFRVNANGSLIDIWLIYQCEKCRHTYNLTVYERTKPGKIPAQLYRDFLANDPELALKCGTSLELFRRNRAEADIDRLEYRYEKCSHDSIEDLISLSSASNVLLTVCNPYRLKVRIDKILPELLCISRSKMKKLMTEGMISFSGNYLGEKAEILLHFPFSEDRNCDTMK